MYFINEGIAKVIQTKADNKGID